MYTRATTSLLCCLLLAAPACQTKPAGKSNAANLAGGQVCALLSDSDIQGIQGEAVSDRQGSARAAGRLIASQCFYRLPTFSKSISLEVIGPAGGEAAGALDEFWDQRFRQDVDADEDEEERLKSEGAGNENEGGRGRPAGREKEEKEGSRPEPVEGIGDRAFWAGDQINASLYVRKDDVILRLSVGGPESQPDKIKKTKALAGQVLKRLEGQS